MPAYDDLAWACYEPAMTPYAQTPKEPPLVYLNSTWSAFLRRRDVPFETEVLRGKDAGASLNEQDYQDTLKKLPIPLLGLPWFQGSHLPSALLIAHEAGHAVEFDFGLTATIGKELLRAGLANSLDWRRSASEVFADLYGCMCLGNYFAGALLDLLVADRKVVKEDDVFGDYPPRHYRVELAVAALEFLGLDAPALEIRQTWEAVYPDGRIPASGAADARRVVAAICGADGMNLMAIVTPPKANVTALAQYAAQGNKTEVARHTDARVLFCALRHVYEHVTAAEYRKASPVLLTQVVQGYAGLFRYRGGPVQTQKDIDAALDEHAGRDAAAGKELEKLFGLDDNNGEESR